MEAGRLVGGQRRLLVFDDLRPERKLLVFEPGATDGLGTVEARRRFVAGLAPGAGHAPDLDATEALALVAREFVAAIAERRAPLTGAASALEVVALVEAAEGWAVRAGCVRLTVTSAEHRADAHAFYPACGIPYTGRRFARAL